MPVNEELLEGLDEDVATKIRESWSADATALDTAKASERTLKGQVTKLTTDRDKWKADFETAGKDRDEQLVTMTGERDSANTRAEAAEGKLTSYMLRTELQQALVDAGVPAKRAKAAAKVLGVPEGAALNDAGELEGADAAIKQFKADHGYFFAANKPGHGGGSPGGDPPPGGGGGKDKLTEREKIDAYRKRRGAKSRSEARA